VLQSSVFIEVSPINNANVTLIQLNTLFNVTGVVEKYKLPFEDKVPHNPTVEETCSHRNVLAATS